MFLWPLLFLILLYSFFSYQSAKQNYYDTGVPINKRKIFRGVLFVIILYGILIFGVNYFKILYYPFKDDIETKNFRSKLKGTWTEIDIDKKYLYAKPSTLNFGRYLVRNERFMPYTFKVLNLQEIEGYFPYKIAGWYIHFDNLAERNDDYRKVLYLSKDTLILSRKLDNTNERVTDWQKFKKIKD